MSKTETPMEPLAVRADEAARLLGVSPVTLRNWRNQGRGPRFTHVGESSRTPVIYPVEALREYANARRGM